jgi:hypothetical protein
MSPKNILLLMDIAPSGGVDWVLTTEGASTIEGRPSNKEVDT